MFTEAEKIRDGISKITGGVGRGVKLGHANLNKQYESSEERQAVFGCGVKVGFGDDLV